MKSVNQWKTKPSKSQTEVATRPIKKHAPFQNAIRIKEVKNGQSNPTR